MTTEALQVNPFHMYSALRGDNKAQATDYLAQVNPFFALSHKSFREILRLTLRSTTLLRGPLTTKTYHELDYWLQVLDGTMTLAEFQAKKIPAWTWEQLAELDVEPVISACYMRMVRDRDAALASTLAVPLP